MRGTKAAELFVEDVVLMYCFFRRIEYLDLTRDERVVPREGVEPTQAVRILRSRPSHRRADGLRRPGFDPVDESAGKQYFELPIRQIVNSRYRASLRQVLNIDRMTFPKMAGK